MGNICFSSSKVSGSNSNTPSTTTTAAAATVNGRRNRRKSANPPSTTTDTSRKQEGSHCNRQKAKESHKNVKHNSRRQSGVIPCGKRTNFGYDKDFDKKFTMGKLLGHGQFGYTYVATDKSNGNRAAVKRIEKKKVLFFPVPCYIKFLWSYVLHQIGNIAMFLFNPNYRFKYFLWIIFKFLDWLWLTHAF